VCVSGMFKASGAAHVDPRRPRVACQWHSSVCNLPYQQEWPWWPRSCRRRRTPRRWSMRLVSDGVLFGWSRAHSVAPADAAGLPTTLRQPSASSSSQTSCCSLGDWHRNHEADSNRLLAELGGKAVDWTDCLVVEMVAGRMLDTPIYRQTHVRPEDLKRLSQPLSSRYSQ